MAAGYSGAPLAKKLGVKDGHAVGLSNAPVDFVHTLGALPPGAHIVDGRTAVWDVSVSFCLTEDDLHIALARAMAKMPSAGGAWIGWPKKASGVPTELSFEAVQHTGLALGLVDNKICAIDDTWSGLRFVVRKENRPSWPR